MMDLLLLPLPCSKEEEEVSQGLMGNIPFI